MGWLFGETVKKDANYHGCRYVWGKLHQKESDLVKLKKVFDSADRSGDGEVDIHEFLMYLDMERTKLIEHIFRQFDTDGGDSHTRLFSILSREIMRAYCHASAPRLPWPRQLEAKHR